MNKLFFLRMAALCGLLIAACGDNTEDISDAALADAAADAGSPCDTSFVLPVELWGNDGGGVNVGGDDEPCTWDLPAPTPEEDRSQLSLSYRMPPANGGPTAGRVSGAAVCEAATQFYLVGDNELHLCPMMCDLIEMAPHTELTVRTACAD